jgi:hypothetical protein
MLSRHTKIIKVYDSPSGEPTRELWELQDIHRFSASVSDMPLNCLENCVDAENPKQFEDTAGDYLYERLVDWLKVIFKIHLICRKTLGTSLMSFTFVLEIKS